LKFWEIEMAMGVYEHDRYFRPPESKLRLKDLLILR